MDESHGPHAAYADYGTTTPRNTSTVRVSVVCICVRSGGRSGRDDGCGRGRRAGDEVLAGGGGQEARGPRATLLLPYSSVLSLRSPPTGYTLARTLRCEDSIIASVARCLLVLKSSTFCTSIAETGSLSVMYLDARPFVTNLE